MPGAFPYAAAAVDEFVRAPKRVEITLEAILKELKTGPVKVVVEPEAAAPMIIEWVLKAGRLEEIQTYKSSLLINAERVRGIDFHSLAQRRYYKEISPAGWHEDIIDPKRGLTRKQAVQLQALQSQKVTDLHDFVLFVASRWNIQIEREEELF